MSQYVKHLITDELTKQLEGVTDALLVNVVGLDANKTVLLRKQLREKDIQLLVVKNSLIKRATEGTPLSPAFEGVEGTLAVVWGGEDPVVLVKEVTRLNDDKEFEAFHTRGGVVDGDQVSPERIKQISTWPTRGEQLSILSAQILSPGASLVAQLLGPGGTLASQIQQKSEQSETEPEGEEG
jgi:ribosomal protein L10